MKNARPQTSEASALNKREFYTENPRHQRVLGLLLQRPARREEVDRTAFPALDLAYAAGRTGGAAPAALNAADEVAVAAFLDGKLPFPGIVSVVASVVEELGDGPASTLEEVLAVDAEARRLVSERIAPGNSSSGVA